ncbi:MAG TPA: hypothetical protein VK814_07285 [Acidobacteriaceae bacterium]|nr:hypothetical protein [Acidobacteriaceae bacterium]
MPEIVMVLFPFETNSVGFRERVFDQACEQGSIGVHAKRIYAPLAGLTTVKSDRTGWAAWI